MHEVGADTWKESTITWNTQPAVGKEVAVFAGLTANNFVAYCPLHSFGCPITYGCFIREIVQSGFAKGDTPLL